MDISSLYKLRFLSSFKTRLFLVKTPQYTPTSSSVLYFHSLRTNSTSNVLSSLVSSAGPASVCARTSFYSQSVEPLVLFACKDRYLVFDIGSLRPCGLFRLLSTSPSDDSSFSNENCGFENVGCADSGESQSRVGAVDEIELHTRLKQVSDVIEVIRKSNKNDVELRLNLNSMNLSLSAASLCEIFRVLNCERVSALRFFDWIRDSLPPLCRNADVCSLIIDNCGQLGDYEAMTCLLNEFNSKQVHLTEKAFGFLPVFSSSKSSIMNSVRKLMEVLNEVGGSCCRSGTQALIKMLCILNEFDIAKSVFEITGRKVSYYNILIKEKCQRCDFKEARNLTNEMRKLGCDPNAKTYNYLLSSLCKSGMVTEACHVLEEMQVNGCFPNALSFEIFIYYSCRLGKLHSALDFLNLMTSRGIEPRLLTHAAFVRGYFYSMQYMEAYNYVLSSSSKYGYSSNMIYSLLASLHRKKGNLVIARNILIEMMEKGLKPTFPVYRKVLKCLHNSGRGYMARDLKSRFSKLTFQSSTASV